MWRPLGGPDPSGKPEYDWNTDSVPDGRYAIRVWASDEKVTPKDRALDLPSIRRPSWWTTPGPWSRICGPQIPRVTGRVHDAASVISQIEFSIDGNDWRPASPDDGILDEMTRGFLPPAAAIACGRTAHHYCARLGFRRQPRVGPHRDSDRQVAKWGRGDGLTPTTRGLGLRLGGGLLGLALGGGDQVEQARVRLVVEPGHKILVLAVTQQRRAWATSLSREPNFSFTAVATR